MIKKYAVSPTTASTGGLQPGVTEEQYAGPVGEAMFSAPKGKARGAAQIHARRTSSSRSRKSSPKKSARWTKPKRKSKPNSNRKPKNRSSPASSKASAASGGRAPSAPRASRSKKSAPTTRAARKTKKPAPPAAGKETKAKRTRSDAETEGCPAPVLQLKPALPGHGHDPHAQRPAARPALAARRSRSAGGAEPRAAPSPPESRRAP